MKNRIVHSPVGITLVAGGKVKSAHLAIAMAFAPILVAADKGAVTAVKAGYMPQAVIGDFDGAKTDLADLVPIERLHQITTQDSTDFEKCLSHIAAPFIIALGATGSRLDHSLAAMNAVAKNPQHRLVLLSGKDLCFLCPPGFEIKLPKGTRLSLFPMTRMNGTSKGLKWPIDGLDFSPLGTIGTSNQTTGSDVLLNFDTSGMLVILPQKHLAAVIAALTRGD
mgnify:CR=1 FL=1